jgi:CheY-like chemotaxis protein
LGASIRIEVEAATDLPRLLADKAQLETALINLASNARDAMPGGGVLTLSAAIEVVTAADTHPAGLAPGRYVRLSVADTGTGIDAAVLRRVTEPFFTTKEQGKGTGLGLSVVKGFAEQSNGGFAISSTVGHGSVAHLFLPEASASTMPPSPAERMPRVAGRRSGQGLHRILLVEDQGPVREVVATELSGHGYEVVQAPDGNSALRMLDAGEVVDLLISDLSMPGMDGIALIAAVQQRRPMLRTILLTGYAEDSASLALGKFTGGSVSLVRKPVTGTQLADHAAVLLEPMMEV